jgi:tetratricopeptide (TPR) repeat protein
MNLQRLELRHVILIGGLALLVITIALVIGPRGLGYPSPQDAHRPVREIGAKAAAERDLTVTEYALRCMDALAKAKPADAIRYCNLALDLDPRNVGALDLRGNAFIMTGQSARALADFSRAIAIAPSDPNGYRFRGVVYTALRRDREALADYNRALVLAPGDLLTIEFRGHLHQVAGRYALAIADFTTVIDAQPGLARVWNSRCWTRTLADADLAAALKDCDTAVRLDPASAFARDSRGFVYVRLKRYANAEQSFDQALKLKPDLASSLFGRAIAKLELHDVTAPKDLAAAKRIEPGIEARFAGYGIRLPVMAPSGT